ncbi:hypothetical protein F5J12DRAFT_785845 [Pisolithus orientalis]|uniref:uncharacterized protein n=1 Tax=Pisolithus orientalis TaxID=936130 RepID=UPI00222423D7|nr:uncharacterized protein F5J12DRAFT_785845 [Pisolithus orientalis]KAI5994285.1 hypothetical protein F5J12DRAFT_785845 [Pisolithus orientalis]
MYGTRRGTAILQKMEDLLMMMEIMMGRIGILHEGAKVMDIPTGDKGMDHQEVAPLKEGITGETHWEMIMMIMVVDAMGEALYAQHIWEQVGQPTGQLGPKVKAMGIPKPGKYKGQDDLEEFNNWLGQLLKYFHTFKVTGLDCNVAHTHTEGRAITTLRAMKDHFHNKGKQPQKYLTVNVQEDAECKNACKEDKLEEGASGKPDKEEMVQEYEENVGLPPRKQMDEEDKPIAYFSAMHHDDEPLDEGVVYCAFIHIDDQEEGLPSEDDTPMVEDNPPEMESGSESDTLSDDVTQTGSALGMMLKSEHLDWSEMYEAVPPGHMPLQTDNQQIVSAFTSTVFIYDLPHCPHGGTSTVRGNPPAKDSEPKEGKMTDDLFKDKDRS